MSSDWSQKRGDEDEKAAEESSEAKQHHHRREDPNSEQQLPSSSPQQQQQNPGGHPPGSHNATRYPPPGAYPYPPPAYPPPSDGSAPPYPPPPRGYEGAPPYGMPPPHMTGYPMYPYQPPMGYPHYPGYPPPPMPYGYPPPDPSMSGHAPGYPPRGDGPSVGPYNTPPTASGGSSPSKSSRKDDADRKLSAHDSSTQPSEDGDEPNEGDEEGIVPGAVTARLKTYIKPRLPSTQDVLDRRSRKNAQSRARASKLRDRIIDIEKKPASERTEEEMQIFQQYEARRQRKNNRSRERALEKKEEIDRILSKPEKKRTKIEKAFLENALSAKKRKNEGDRLRRQRLKELGLSTKGSGMKPGISARGPLPNNYGHQPHPHHMQPPAYGGHMGEIPMSPMPPMVGHHHTMQSPGAFGSPGMMPNMGFHSPQHTRGGGPQPGVMETPGRTGAPLPYIPPPQTFDAQTPPPNGNQHHYQQPHSHPNSRVEQRRHPDGSMSISIGGNTAQGSSFGGETRMPGPEEQNAMNISDVSHLLLYDNGDEAEADQALENGQE